MEVEQENVKQNEMGFVKEILETGMIEIMSDGRKYEEYLRTLSKFYRHNIDNIMLIYKQRPEAIYIDEIDTWEYKFHRHIRECEHGITVLSPSAIHKEMEFKVKDPITNKPVLGEDGEPLMELRPIIVWGYKPITVYDISQTYGGEPLPEIIRVLDGENSNYRMIMKAINELLAPVTIETSLINCKANGYYSKDEKRVVIKEGLSEIQEIKTALRGLAYARIHIECAFEHEIYDCEVIEIQAESVAYALCSHFGIVTPEYSFDHISSWSVGKSEDFLKRNLNVIKNTASSLIEGIEVRLFYGESEDSVIKRSKDIDYFEDAIVIYQTEKPKMTGKFLL